MTSTTPTVRRAIAVAMLVSGAALVTACGQAGSPANPGTTVTVTATPGSAPPATSPPSQASHSAEPVSSPAQAGPPPCATRGLQVKLGVSQGAAGSIYQVIDFTNISGSTCSLYGYPGVSFAGGSPVHQIGLAANEDPATPRQLVTLGPGAVASALLRIVEAGNFPASKCDLVTTTYLQIYPPNQTTPVYLAYKSQACAKPVHTLTVDVVKPGSGS